jgi:hypothetical protein
LISLAQGTHTTISGVKERVDRRIWLLGDSMKEAFPNIVINICVVLMTSVVLTADLLGLNSGFIGISLTITNSLHFMKIMNLLTKYMIMEAKVQLGSHIQWD